MRVLRLAMPGRDGLTGHPPVQNPNPWRVLPAHREDSRREIDSTEKFY